MGLSSYLFGKNSEDRACDYLLKLKFKILERNFRSKFGEIDIIAVDESDTLCFIEVKASGERSSQMGFDSIYRLTPSKYAKILKTIDFYMLKNNVNQNFEISLITIDADNIDMIRNISL